MPRKTNGTDKRPEPKPRKHPQLWQSYLMWDELTELRKRHLLRIASVDAGKSQMDAELEHVYLEGMAVDTHIDNFRKLMRDFGSKVGPIWEWVTAIRGLKEGNLAAQLLAQIDDIAKFDTVSKLWRFAGYAVIEGEAEHGMKGAKLPYNTRLKSIIFLIVDQFIRQQTPLYVDIYYAEKERIRRLHPEPELAPTGSAWPQDYTDSHVHRMAMRKTGKIFLQHLWVTWRAVEGLPVSEPYVQAILQHTHIIAAPTSTD